MEAWLEAVKVCTGWNEDDQERIQQLHLWLDTHLSDVVTVLAAELAECNGVKPLMSNKRFVEGLHNLLRDWLKGFLDGGFDGLYAERRKAFGRKLLNSDLAFEDVILLQGLARQEMLKLIQEKLQGRPEELLSMMSAVDKAMNVDSALVYRGYLQVRDDQLEQELLDQFIDVTGFSRTLYENLTEG